MVRKLPSPIFAIGGGILLVAIVIATTTHLRVVDTRSTPAFIHVLVWQLVIWAPWAALARLVFRLGGHVKPHGARGLVTHLVASTGVAFVHAAWFIFVSSRFSPYLGVEGTKYGVFAFFFLFWMQLDLLLYWAVLGYGAARQYHREALERQRRAAQLQLELVEAQLQALKFQLQPHFLFNTLNTIVAMMRSGENDKALNMCMALGDMLRLVLDGGDANEVALARELKLLDKYLEIQLYRFEDRLTVVRQIDDGVLDARVPSLLLQPVVENAIQHGVALSSKSGSIGLCAHREGPDLVVEVTNDLARTGDRGPGHGIGLANTRSRLEELYGDPQRLSIETTPDQKVRVRLAVPWREMDAPREEATL